MEVFGIRLVGVNAENGQKLLLTLGFIALLAVARAAVGGVVRLVLRGRAERARFWARQAVNVAAALLLLLGLLSIWFDDPTRLATGLGLVTAGLAFALQKVVTALAGYVVILRGRNFTVGDRITMGGVRGDVIALGFIQTTIMEMGQPPAVQGADPAMWVRSRQYTGRVVTVANARLRRAGLQLHPRLPLPLRGAGLPDPLRRRPAARRADHPRERRAPHHAGRGVWPGGARPVRRRYFVRDVAELRPKVYYGLTDNWLELSARFVVAEHGVREVKDAIGREVLDRFDEAGIGLASATFEIVGLPPLRVAGRAAARSGG